MILKEKPRCDSSLLNTFVDESVDKKSFDKKSGDQANQVTLTGTVTFTGLSYKNTDIVALPIHYLTHPICNYPKII
jgi:hypothetical protein